MASPRVATNRFVAQLLRESFYQFFLAFWSTIAAERLVNSWYIKKLCDELQEISERVFDDKPKEYDLFWNCPPGTSKSSVVSVLWQPWIWTRMPSARFISGSYSERLALDLSRKSRDCVLSEPYRELFPEIELRSDQNTKSHFANTAGGFRYAVGVGGSVTGMHAHFIAIDDPIDPIGALSDLVLAEANSWMSETLPSRKVNRLLTPTVCIMQRLHQNDPTGAALEKNLHIRNRCVPCDTTWEIKPPEWKEHYEDGLLDSERLPQVALEEARIELGEAGYAGQYGQNPVPRGGAMFKVDRLLYQNVAPEKWKRGPVRYYDKAATLKGGAWTVGAKLALDEYDKVWILDIVRGQWDSGFRETMILSTARVDGRRTRQIVEQEPAGAGKESAESTVKRVTLAGYRCTMDKVTGDKELRADPFSQHVNMGNVVLLVAPWNKVLVEELRFFPRSKYKDQVDACSGGFAMLVKRRIRLGVL